MSKYILFLTNIIQGKKCKHNTLQIIGKEPDENNLSFIVELMRSHDRKYRYSSYTACHSGFPGTN